MMRPAYITRMRCTVRLEYGGVVGNQDKSKLEFGLELAQQIQDFRLHRRIQGSGGLVGYDQGWTADNRLGNNHSLSLPSAELMRESGINVTFASESHLREQLFRGCPRLPDGQVLMGTEHLGNLIADAHDRVQRRPGFLMHQRNAGATYVLQISFAQRKEIDSLKYNLALLDDGGFGQEAKQRKRHRGFAASRFSQDAQGFTRLQLESHAAQRMTIRSRSAP